MGRRIIMKDGTELEGSVGYASGVIWLYIQNAVVEEVALIVIDPEKTGLIRNICGETMDVYEGFTHLTVLIKDGDTINIQLQGENTNVQQGLPAPAEEGEADETA